MDKLNTHQFFAHRSPRNASATRLTLWRLLITPAALDALRIANISVSDLLIWRVNSDWGNLTEEDRRQNDLALETGLRILSS
jgi:hypothetical protein